VFSPWALHPGLDPLKLAFEAGAVLLAALVAFLPRRRSLPQVCALGGAITLAVQLPAEHWFYYYIVWFMPFVIVALLAGEGDGGTVMEEEGSTATALPSTAPRPPAPVSAGV
jgi:hypothetical protein